MQIVVDTSVLIAVVANEASKPMLVTATRGAALVAPASVHWEIGNAFAAMLKRERLRLPQVRKALTAYREIPIRYVDVDLEEAVVLADRHKMYAYDAYVLACALDQRALLLTLDRGLTRAASAEGVDIVEVGS